MFLFFLLLLSTIKLNSFLRIIVIISYIFVISFMYWNISFIFISVVMIKEQLFYESNCTRSLEINTISTLALSFGLTTNWFWIKFKEFNGLLCRSTLLYEILKMFFWTRFLYFHQSYQSLCPSIPWVLIYSCHVCYTMYQYNHWAPSLE